MNRQPSSSWALSLIAVVCALLSCAVPQRAASQALHSQAGAYELEVLVDGVAARTFEHGGETHVLGQEGSRYVLRVHNRSGRRIEAVVSVDGLDVIDGKAGDFASKRGYLVDAYGYVDIDGWRLSNREAAAFRFAPIGESYAAKTGSARNVGVIGVAVFPELVRRPRPVIVPETHSFQPPQGGSSSRGYGGIGRRSEAKAGAAQEAETAPPRAAPAPSSSKSPSQRADAADALASQEAPRRARSGLGTEFGEAVSSEIRQVAFIRAHASRPAALLGARYNDRAGLYALGIDVDQRDEPSDLALRQSADPFPVSRGFARPPADWRHD